MSGNDRLSYLILISSFYFSLQFYILLLQYICIPSSVDMSPVLRWSNHCQSIISGPSLVRHWQNRRKSIWLFWKFIAGVSVGGSTLVSTVQNPDQNQACTVSSPPTALPIRSHQNGIKTRTRTGVVRFLNSVSFLTSGVEPLGWSGCWLVSGAVQVVGMDWWPPGITSDGLALAWLFLALASLFQVKAKRFGLGLAQVMAYGKNLAWLWLWLGLALWCTRLSQSHFWTMKFPGRKMPLFLICQKCSFWQADQNLQTDFYLLQNWQQTGRDKLLALAAYIIIDIYGRYVHIWTR